ncbi:MAG: xanthan lyase, partial [Bacteroidaceae bacterium]
MDGFVVDSGVKTLHVYGKEGFGSRVFDSKEVAKAYDRLRACLETLYTDFDLKLYGRGGVEIDRLVPNLYAEVVDSTRLWLDKNHEGEFWVRNLSRPFDIKRGMEGVHLAVWPSHGRYFDFHKKEWKWQRPYLYATTEDLFTRSIVVPFLIPMIEKAGGIVFCSRERDCRTEELIVDNDSGGSMRGGIYLEKEGKNGFNSFVATGFGVRSNWYEPGRNPHLEGTARVMRTSREEEGCSSVCWMPDIKVEGEYALYVTYPTLEGSVSDAVYIVRHRNVETRVSVNQRMGGGMWVYLGTFDFGSGQGIENSVTLTNVSSQEGVVCADAIRLGGGMGNMVRIGTTSGLPRCLEGALYYAQWLGMPC